MRRNRTGPLQKHCTDIRLLNSQLFAHYFIISCLKKSVLSPPLFGWVERTHGHGRLHRLLPFKGSSLLLYRIKSRAVELCVHRVPSPNTGIPLHSEAAAPAVYLHLTHWKRFKGPRWHSKFLSSTSLHYVFARRKSEPAGNKGRRRKGRTGKKGIKRKIFCIGLAMGLMGRDA